jgi:restriction endonuclease S subunit
MSNKNLVQITTDEDGKEVVTVRADKTLREIMAEKHWDPKYYHPNTEKILNDLASEKYPLKSLSDFIGNGPEYITYGQVGKRTIVNNSPVKYITTRNIIETGLNLFSVEKYTPENGWNDPERSRPKKFDIFFVGNGVGCAGRVIWLDEKPPRANIEQNIVILRPKSINRAYVTVYLKSIFGTTQIFRVKDRVGAAYINFDEIKAIKIPIIPDNIQKNIEVEYKKMSKYHDKAMGAKKKGKEVEYKNNIEIAEKMLKDLIVKTEAVIRGERKDII